MNDSITFKNHPFKFLLYLEWTLLTIAILIEFIPIKTPLVSTYKPFQGAIESPILNLICLVIFAVIGLKLPKANQSTKIIYIVAEVLLIFLAIFSSKSIRLFAPLYIIMVIRSCLMFQWLGRIAVSLISFALFSFTFINILHGKEYMNCAQVKLRFLPINIIFPFGLTFLFILLFMNAIISERQSRDKLLIANEKLRQYALKIENQATLEERSRIAREIHDSLGHSLTALNLQLETAIKLWELNPKKAEYFLARAKELGSQALQDVRNSVSTLRSNTLQYKSLEEAIAVLIEDFQKTNNILPKYQIKIEHPLSIEINTAIYRIIQESLTNISKHSQATAVTFKITTTINNLRLVLKDNGKGFDVKQNTSGFGLQSIRDRTLALGGNLNIKTAPNSGCKIIVEIPLI
ncbi:sensor histidine kinase [Mastigocoleus testarum]|uniref:histidine kinase n=1 Tax=Mastigocoleus testarum BC008 TaxID=371196 RepID=A0A0V7ZC41_9CYAN|nr:sensor histidine kinase [Mastigocoleus testarum]KST62078.1 ATPase [Mastigocoleus testarum BC008]